MHETGKFIGPLSEKSLLDAGNDFGIFHRSDIAFEIARERTGRELAQLALNEANEKLEHSKIDHMTGLLRRDAFIEAVNKALPTLRYHNPRRMEDRDAALFMMLDIVDLHGINNRGGQIAGDEAIKSVAQFMRFIARTTADSPLRSGLDIAGRLGGDEFALFIPYHHDRIKHDQMIDIIEDRIQLNRLTNYDTQTETPSIRYDFYSIWLGQRLPSAEELLQRADPKRPGAKTRFSHPIEPQDQLFK